MGYVIAADNTLLITTREQSLEHLVERVYDLYALVPPPSNNPAPRVSRTVYASPTLERRRITSVQYNPGDVDADSFTDAITSCIAPATWSFNGGSSTIASFGYSLVVEQTDENQRRIAGLLAALLAAKGRADDGPREPIEVNVADPASRSKIAKSLDARHDFNLVDVPLTEFADTLRKLNIPVMFDVQALADAKITVDEKITLQAKNIRIADGLRLALGAIELNFWADDGFVFITAEENCRAHVVPVVYPVGDLLAMTTDMYGNESLDDSDLVEAITSSILPSSWTQSGGSAEIRLVPDARALVVCQSAEGHRACVKLLANLRANRHVEKAAAPNPNELLVEKYQVKPESLDQCIAIVHATIEPKSWNAEGVYIVTIGDALVIRQTRAVHRQVLAFLESLGLMSPAPVQNSGMSGGAF